MYKHFPPTGTEDHPPQSHKILRIDIEYLIFKFIKLKIQFSGKYIFLVYKNKSLEQNLVINLIIMFGKYHMHKQKWSNNKPNVTLFKIEFKHYIEALKDLRNKKAKRI